MMKNKGGGMMKNKILFLILFLLFTPSLLFAVIKSPNLKGGWRFEGNANDWSGNGNNGTVYGATLTTGKFGQCYSFASDGTNYITAGNPVITGAFTVAAWVKVSDTGVRGIAGTRGPGDYGFDMKLHNGNQIHADIGTDTGWITTFADASFTYSTGTWYHIVYVVTQTGYTIYANGNNVGSGSYASTTPVFSNATHTIQISGIGVGMGGERFYGLIDEVRIYNRALNASEVRSLMLGYEPGEF